MSDQLLLSDQAGQTLPLLRRLLEWDAEDDVVLVELVCLHGATGRAWESAARSLDVVPAVAAARWCALALRVPTRTPWSPGELALLSKAYLEARPLRIAGRLGAACFYKAMSNFIPGRSPSAVRQAVNVKLLHDMGLGAVQEDSPADDGASTAIWQELFSCWMSSPDAQMEEEGKQVAKSLLIKLKPACAASRQPAATAAPGTVPTEGANRHSLPSPEPAAAPEGQFKEPQAALLQAGWQGSTAERHNSAALGPDASWAAAAAAGRGCLPAPLPSIAAGQQLITGGLPAAAAQAGGGDSSTTSKKRKHDLMDLSLMAMGGVWGLLDSMQQPGVGAVTGGLQPGAPAAGGFAGVNPACTLQPPWQQQQLGQHTSQQGCGASAAAMETCMRGSFADVWGLIHGGSQGLAAPQQQQQHRGLLEQDANRRSLHSQQKHCNLQQQQLLLASSVAAGAQPAHAQPPPALASPTGSCCSASAAPAAGQLGTYALGGAGGTSAGQHNPGSTPPADGCAVEEPAAQRPRMPRNQSAPSLHATTVHQAPGMRPNDCAPVMDQQVQAVRDTEADKDSTRNAQEVQHAPAAADCVEQELQQLAERDHHAQGQDQGTSQDYPELSLGQLWAEGSIDGRESFSQALARLPSVHSPALHSSLQHSGAQQSHPDAPDATGLTASAAAAAAQIRSSRAPGASRQSCPGGAAYGTNGGQQGGSVGWSHVAQLQGELESLQQQLALSLRPEGGATWLAKQQSTAAVHQPQLGGQCSLQLQEPGTAAAFAGMPWPMEPTLAAAAPAHAGALLPAWGSAAEAATAPDAAAAQLAYCQQQQQGAFQTAAGGCPVHLAAAAADSSGQLTVSSAVADLDVLSESLSALQDMLNGLQKLAASGQRLHAPGTQEFLNMQLGLLQRQHQQLQSEFYRRMRPIMQNPTMTLPQAGEFAPLNPTSSAGPAVIAAWAGPAAQHAQLPQQVASGTYQINRFDVAGLQHMQ